MSQSPIDDFSDQATLSYKQGWRALNRLLHEDRSFSGHERHCAFLNTGGDTARFADVSAVTGFDFADDGRGLATADWDFDGDLDVWISNRTAPRVRLLKNNTSASKQFVAFTLQGDGIGTNRDAIGARLELHLATTAQPIRIRTLHAGEGFLSQSSAWIHFGLGDATQIEKLIVRWPGAAPQEFTGIQAGKFYKLRQGKPAAIRFTPPAERKALLPTEQLPTPLTETARIIVPAGLPIPAITVHTAGDQLATHQLSTQRPTLINLWSSTCSPCLSELTEWHAHRDQLTAAGVDVLTLSTDHLTAKHDPAKTIAALARTGSNFPNKRISDASLQSLDDAQRSVLDRWLPLPVPSTFLVNTEGELIAIYKGPVSTRQLLQDIPLAAASPKDRRTAALPFSGQWVGAPVPADPKRVASIMLDHNRLESATDYLAHCAKFMEKRLSGEDGKHGLGDLYFMAGTLNATIPAKRIKAIERLARARDLIPNDLRIRLELGRQLMTQGNLQDALPEFTAASAIDPSNISLRQDTAVIHFRLGNHAQAKELLSPIVAANPDNGLAQYHLANTEVHLKNMSAAIDGYRKTLKSAPKLIDAANNLAWILASHPDANLRSPDEAIALTQRLCQMTKEKQPQFLDTHSVALANAGKFPQAIEAANKAIALHPPENQAATDPIRSRIKLYQAGQAYRETNWQH